jgi:hypothetical protein
VFEDGEEQEKSRKEGGSGNDGTWRALKKKKKSL